MLAKSHRGATCPLFGRGTAVRATTTSWRASGSFERRIPVSTDPRIRYRSAVARLVGSDGSVLAEGRTVEHRRVMVDARTAAAVATELVEGLAAVSWSMAGLGLIVDGAEAVLTLDDGTVHKVIVSDHRLMPSSTTADASGGPAT